MKKYLPIALLLVGAFVVVGAYFVVIKKPAETIDEEAQLVEIPIADRPIVSLTPTADGHWLVLNISKLSPVIDKYESSKLEYELLYNLPDGRTQGVPGSITLSDDIGDIEKELLLGSESSGKFRYDEGVERGTITLKFRNDKGKLISKLSSEFNLQSDTDELASVDGNFSYKLEDENENYFVTMKTMGIPGESPDVPQEPCGIFSSSKDEVPGEVVYAGQVQYRWTGDEWEKLDDSNASDIGFFLAFSE